LWTRVQGGIERVLEQTTLAELAAFAEGGFTATRTAGATPRPRTRVRATTSRSRTQEKRTVRNG
jgi:hypothetical protein